MQLEKSREISPEGMKRLSKSRDKCLVVDVSGGEKKSDDVKNNTV